MVPSQTSASQNKKKNKKQKMPLKGSRGRKGSEKIVEEKKDVIEEAKGGRKMDKVRKFMRVRRG